MKIDRTIFVLLMVGFGYGYALHMFFPSLFNLNPLWGIVWLMLFIVLPKPAGYWVLLLVLLPILLPYFVLCLITFGLSAIIQKATGYALLTLD